jgi:excisionase family DNA binding protein
VWRQTAAGIDVLRHWRVAPTEASVSLDGGENPPLPPFQNVLDLAHPRRSFDIHWAMPGRAGRSQETHRWLNDDLPGSESRRAFFTERTLAAYLAVSDRTVRDWIRRGELPSYKLGGSRRIDPADVERFLDQRREGGVLA